MESTQRPAAPKSKTGLDEEGSADDGGAIRRNSGICGRFETGGGRWVCVYVRRGVGGCGGEEGIGGDGGGGEGFGGGGGGGEGFGGGGGGEGGGGG
eukprot:CAMPEP_0119322840 /NCGR_PEP_ID=MMETSP1333-20130426/59317_1 /TAXON_ID=418940 /ORGANISM="Scyphosphaera apsteinii, Strain RCC1455" /LENGTH=95 /DNA_ID=CAMNT_0007330171 /DNA_START=341 /DNA_END=624 /DNA_ORIENTATION=-